MKTVKKITKTQALNNLKILLRTTSMFDIKRGEEGISYVKDALECGRDVEARENALWDAIMEFETAIDTMKSFITNCKIAAGGKS